MICIECKQPVEFSLELTDVCDRYINCRYQLVLSCCCSATAEDTEDHAAEMIQYLIDKYEGDYVDLMVEMDD